MSLNFEDVGPLIAIIKNENKAIKDKKLFISDNVDSVRNGFSNYQTNKNETLQLVPNNKTERQCIYICGQSGSGKSYFTSNYVKQYKKMYPKRDIFVISSISEDSSIDSLKPKRINVLHEDFLTEEFTSEDFKDSLVIFDDVDVFPNKIKKKVMAIVNNILQIGRHSNVSVCFTTHNPTNGAETKILLSEAHVITVFPRTTGNRALKYLLDSYLGLDQKQINRIKKMNSRAVSIIRGYPMVILSDKEALLAHEF
jgi:DNA helicase HerA-like ATPase